MDTRGRLEKAKELLSLSGGDKILQIVKQLINICENQQVEIEELHRANKIFIENDWKVNGINNQSRHEP